MEGFWGMRIGNVDDFTADRFANGQQTSDHWLDAEARGVGTEEHPGVQWTLHCVPRGGGAPRCKGGKSRRYQPGSLGLKANGCVPQ